MHIFLTGGFGYVGRAAANELTRRGARLSVLARDAAEAARVEAAGWQPVRAGLDDPAGLAAACAAADAVVHAAASDAPAFLPINRAAIVAMLAALRPGAGFVTHAGTLLFGPSAEPQDGAGPLRPPPFLAERAALDEQIVTARPDLRVAVAFAGLVYGGAGAAIPNVYAGAVRALGFAPVPGDGAQAWSTVHVEDWARLIADAVERAAPGGRRYIAASGEVTLGEFARRVGAAFGVDARPADAAALAALGMFGAALAMPQRFTGRRAVEELGWRPAQTDLDLALAALAAAR